jgi:hypothetical protein
MNKYELIVNDRVIIVNENRLISVLVFNNSFTHNQLDKLKIDGQITVNNKLYKLKKI